MNRRWKISEVNRVTERKERLSAVNAWGRKMHAVRNLQKKGMKSMRNEGQGGVINEKPEERKNDLIVIPKERGREMVEYS